MSESSTTYRSVRDLVDSKHLLDVLLRQLIKKGTVTAKDLDTVLGVTISKVLETVKAQAITIFMLDEESKTLAFKYVYFSTLLYGKDEQLRQLYEQRSRQLENLKLGWGQGIVGDAIKTGQPALVADAPNDKRFLSVIDELTGFITQSVLAVPLKANDHVVGCIEVINKCEDGRTITPFTQRDVFLVADVASFTSKVVHRALDADQYFSDVEMAQFVARLYRCEYIDLDLESNPDADLLKQIGESTLLQYNIVPLCRLAGNKIKAAMVNPNDWQAIEDFETLTQLTIEQKVVAVRSQLEEAVHNAFARPAMDPGIQALLERQFGPEGGDSATPDGKEETETAELVLQLSRNIIENACKTGASDIHIEPQETKAVVRYRIDGACVQAMNLPKSLHEALISRFKVMSQLDISEKRLPQDGRIPFKKFYNNLDIDLRVSTAPMQHGEKLCMRLLDKTKATLSLDRLGFSSYNLGRYRDLIQSPYGIILHCGPTGSGKSLTLYSALNEINRPDVNICTAEDPVEYTLPGINQMQMRSDIGLNFARALRCFLRQDPDIILVGEIRDRETAEIALEAALTGHLVFATLHTNDAVSTVSRLVEMGVPAYMVSAALVGVCAQRLIRRLCIHCKQPAAPLRQERELLELARDGSPLERIFQAGACPKCSQTGYKGRTGIHELLCVNEELRELISRNAPTAELKRASRAQGMRTLFEDAMEKVKGGITSFPEGIGSVRPEE